MNQNIKRINLTFDLSRKNDREVYDWIIKESSKTAFVINKMLVVKKYESKDEISIEDIKQAVSEVLYEMAIINTKPDNLVKKDVDDENNIPDIMFELFDKL